MKYPNIGTVSEATMLPEDLIPSFMSVLEQFDPETVSVIELEYKELFEVLDSVGFDRFEGELEDQASYLVDALFDALQAIAPPYCSFGSNEGDGADYGFWPDIESLEDDARILDGVVKVNDGDDWSFDCGGILISHGRIAELRGDDTNYVMSVSDHGNVTLYDARTRQEIWAIV